MFTFSQLTHLPKLFPRLLYSRRYGLLCHPLHRCFWAFLWGPVRPWEEITVVISPVLFLRRKRYLVPFLSTPSQTTCKRNDVISLKNTKVIWCWLFLVGGRKVVKHYLLTLHSAEGPPRGRLGAAGGREKLTPLTHPFARPKLMYAKLIYGP